MPIAEERAFLYDLKRWLNNRISSGTYCKLSIAIQRGKVETATVERLYVLKDSDM